MLPSVNFGYKLSGYGISVLVNEFAHISNMNNVFSIAELTLVKRRIFIFRLIISA